MTGLKRARLIWSIVFLGVTLIGIVMELVAGLWHPTGWTIPWTEYIARYVPWPVQLLAYVVLATWLPFHFWRHDHLRKIAFETGRTLGRGEGHANGYSAGRRATVEEAAAMLREQAAGSAVSDLRPGLAKAAQWVSCINDSMVDGR